MNKQIRILIMGLLYIAFLGVVLPANALERNFYHKIGYRVEPSGAGTVYANGPKIMTESIWWFSFNYNVSYDYESTNSSNEKYVVLDKNEWKFDEYPEGVDMLYTLHAQNTDNKYQFDHWEIKNGNSWERIEQNPVSLEYAAPSVFVTNYRNTNPNPSASYKAVFSLKGVLKAEVATGQENLGNVTNSKVDNQPGDNVTLTARSTQSFRGVTFSHWTIDGNSEYISKKNPLDTIVPNVESIVFRAHFTEPSNYSYCRFENVATGKFISLYSKAASTTSSSSMTVNALKLLNSTTSMGDPSTVFYVGGTSDNLEGLSAVTLLESQGVNLKDEKDGVLKSYNLKFTKEGEYYHISTMSSNNQFYLTDNYSSNPVFMSSQGNNSLWKVHFLDEDHVGEHAFGVAPDSRMYQNGKYYTTLYTKFPYKMLDGIKAYYLDITKADQIYNAKAKKITAPHDSMLGQVEADNEDRIIPKNMAVILECNGINPERNRLLPIVDKNNSIREDKYVTDKNNPLKGALVVGGNLTGESAARKSKLPESQNYVYVYSAKNGHVSFYKWTGDKKVIPNNKVYLAVTKNFEGESSSDGNAAKGYTFTWGLEETENNSTTGIDNVVLTEEDGAIYNLQGSKVTNPSAGVYIKNGKKIIVK